MTADDKYSLRKSENLPQPIEMQLFKKRKVFSKVFASFLKTTSHFQQFEKNMSLIADIFGKLRRANNVVRKMSKKPSFRTPFGNKHAKGSWRLLKYAQKHFYLIFSWLLGNRVRKCLSQFYLKSHDCLLTHWLQMTSILFVIVRIHGNQFKSSYLRKKTLSEFLFSF